MCIRDRIQPLSRQDFDFPEGFLWGAATAAQLAVTTTTATTSEKVFICRGTSGPPSGRGRQVRHESA